jgi:hypothetical protein
LSNFFVLLVAILILDKAGLPDAHAHHAVISRDRERAKLLSARW